MGRVGTSVAQEGLPKFTKPPVIEVVISVEFVPLAELNVVQLVQISEQWRDTYPLVTPQPPILSVPPPGSMLSGVGISINDTNVRLWLTDESGHELLQLQNDRLVLNWRRQEDPDATYPSYKQLREVFAQRWEEFVGRLPTGARLRPLTAEVTFVNKLEAVDGAPPGQLSGFIAPLSAPDLPGEETSTIQTQLQYLVPISGDAPGQLIVTAVASSSGAQLNVACRLGLVGDTALDRIMGALDAAHASCVQGFTNITTIEMHAAWGRTA